jgi:Co/Zn/Cd efflux system component
MKTLKEFYEKHAVALFACAAALSIINVVIDCATKQWGWAAFDALMALQFVSLALDKNIERMERELSVLQDSL